ncbi:MAG: hemerythrin domain-containing protein [Acidobacteriota bacterium]
MNIEDESRRRFLKYGAVGIGSAVMLSSCAPPEAGNAVQVNLNVGDARPGDADKKPGDEIEVTAVEYLMREHGVLRRALLIYSEVAIRLRKNTSEVSPDTLQKTAKLFRRFGEDYHEKMLEEAFIFPKIREKGNLEAAKYPDILTTQHARGREITEHIISVTGGAKINTNSLLFADTLDGFVRMYNHHAAREDTIIFPAWKDVLTPDEYDEMNDKFEEIEHQQFGEDGFEDAVKQIGEIEVALGLDDISKFTPLPILA